MGFPGVVPEHVPGTLGEHGIFPVPCSLFPVPLRIPHPQNKNLRQFSLRRPCGASRDLFPARFTSRPEARGSGVEAVFRFLGSGVDFF